MTARIGTSGYSYKEWKGSFYPEDLPSSRMLPYYAERFSTVEINNTFYRMPSPEVLERWRGEVPPSFQFALKAPQSITHVKRLKDAGETVARFFQVAEALSAQLGPVLFQLPPHLKKDLARLEVFLAGLPAGRACAFEFRHESWFGDEVLEALRSRRVALCVSQSDELDTPLVSTAPWGYLRLRRSEYSERDLAAWAEKIRAMGWTELFVFFKHEDEGRGPQLAGRLARLLAE